jgi:prepilin-type N-terminal cleavage/methylation domain-containing protein
MGKMMRSEYRNLQRGFSLLELMVTLTIILAAMAVAVIQVMPVVRNARVDSAKQLVQDQLRTARAQAISDRGEYIVTFTTTGTITTTAPGVTGFNPITVSLPADVQFYLFSGMPTTPDGFVPSGNAVDLDQAGSSGNPLKVRFEPNGSAIDDAGSLNSGVVYIAKNNGDPTTQRAITLLGATSRVRTWTIMKSGSVYKWK